jgi:transposase
MATLPCKEAERRRRQAAALLDQGWSQTQVARHFGVTVAAVCQWARVYRRDGPVGLKAGVHTGRPPRLTARQCDQLARLLLSGPQKHGYANALWTLPRIAAVIRRHFGVTYDPSGVWHVLHRLGWSCQKPERRARERDEKAIAHWRRHVWPHIKKRPPEG